MITIGVDGNEANVDQRVGVSNYTRNLLLYFAKTANINTRFEIYLKLPPKNSLPTENQYFHYRVIPGKFLWSQVTLPIYLYQHKNIDVYFAPAHYLPRFCPVPQVVTIHDLAYLYFPEDFTKKDFWQLKNWTNRSMKNASQIIAVSKTTKKDILKNYSINENKVSVVYNGYEKPSMEKTSAVQKSDIHQAQTAEVKPKKYILFVGTLQPRKNLNILIDAFNRLIESNKVFKLVITGKKGWLYSSIFEKVKTLDLQDRIIFTDHVSDSELKSLYKNAFCFVQPSLYEGFGIPILEAMSYGCPVVSSFSSSLPEVGGEACLYFNPEKAEDLLEKLNSLIINNSLRNELVTKGYKRVKEFSWEKCGRETLDTLRSVLNKDGP